MLEQLRCAARLLPSNHYELKLFLAARGRPIPKYYVRLKNSRGRDRCSRSHASSAARSGALCSWHPQTFFGTLAIDAAFDIEQRVDALDRFERDRRDRRCFLSAPGIGGDVRQLEELPASVGPTQCGGDRPRPARGIVELVVAAIRIRLQERRRQRRARA
jgi:hypothetical protein